MEKFIAEGHEWSKEFEQLRFLTFLQLNISNMQYSSIWCFGPKRCGTNILFNRSHYSTTP